MLKIRTIFIFLATGCGLALFAGATAAAQTSVADFYNGKTVNLIVGGAVGGGSDSYARLVGRYISRHIPGNPSVVVQNMPGATSAKFASYLAAQAAKDGSLIGTVNSSLVLAPLLSGHALSFDPSKFNYLGSANSDVYLCVVRGDAPVKSFQEALSRPVIMGTTGPGSKSYDFPRMLGNVVGAKFQIVTGYAGTLEVSLAIEKGEVQGMCGLSWSTLSVQHPDWLKRGVVRVLVQEDLIGHPELNKMGVPLAVGFAKTEDERRIIELFYSQNVFGRPFVAPEGIPPDRLAALRAAFLSTLHDEKLLADAAKMGLDISAQPGNDIQTLVTKLYGFPANVIERAKQAVANKPPT